MIYYGKQTIDEDDVKAISEAVLDDLITTGPKTKQFEEELANFCNVKYCVAVSNGTVALHLASKVILNKGDKVLTTPNSFLATSNSILYVGAKPIFVDIAKDGNIDLDLCEEELNKDSSIKAIYAVAFSGNMINQEKLKYLKKTYNIKILEDNAHAIGAVYDGIKAGSCTNSDCSIFSFHPVKHMTTGEGGAITTNSKEIYDKLLMLRNHGMTKRDGLAPWEYEMTELGINGRITDIQCALGISQLRKLDKFIDRRIEIAKIYDETFEDSIVEPLYTYDGKSSYHLYVVKVDFSKIKLSKQKLYEVLRDKYGIVLQIHYMPINKQPYYKSLGYGDENTPIMDKYYQECFSLPIYPLLTNEEQEYVIKSLFEVLND
ncbi:Bacillosamine/Legionaminic acid biosynthesis aminotransferase PglE; 4-keto-6-deoxy-N-Acetyl-D-hexosaminyl-(Lipid carrier) aminotransferase [hydrothermal vent metagenome]|uniref:Bacillosamine/Legionaminic acid biosynthesis aminotransferase PglE 4-keto-6-deoxy-N-Acetyl-D-hexosaminyl-(Lipid carrier) aminotransferase n=1 Tax=hydrothermal vent metagenome TaxID=652676 RepID=A0A1W1C9L8_9ZZZZ